MNVRRPILSLLNACGVAPEWKFSKTSQGHRRRPQVTRLSRASQQQLERWIKSGFSPRSDLLTTDLTFVREGPLDYVPLPESIDLFPRRRLNRCHAGIIKPAHGLLVDGPLRRASIVSLMAA